jgi:nitrogen fixation NifU-like protein
MTVNQDDEVEKFARELQQQIMEEIRRAYSPVVIEHWQNPRNFKSLDSPDGYARVKGVCGDSMEMFLRVKDDKVIECTFQTDGCGTTIVCGSVVTELALGKSFVEALGSVNAAEILRVLGGLPEDSTHCAQLAAETLRRALADYLYHKSGPWRKKYRKT